MLEGSFFSRYIIRLNTKNMTTFAVVKARDKMNIYSLR